MFKKSSRAAYRRAVMAKNKSLMSEAAKVTPIAKTAVELVKIAPKKATLSRRGMARRSLGRKMYSAN